MEIYATKISDIVEEKIDKLCLFVSSENKYKIERFVHKKDKIRGLIGELLIKNIITEKLGVISKNIIFNKNPYGKPYLKDYQDFNFNIAHSGEFVVCAIDKQCIGIDIEKIRDIEYKTIAEKFFAKKELDFILNADEKKQLSNFYEIWTLRESLLKADGRGLSIPLKSFSIEVDDYGEYKIIGNCELKKYTLKNFDIEGGYKMSVCSLKGEFPDNVIILEQNRLISNYLRVVQL